MGMFIQAGEMSDMSDPKRRVHILRDWNWTSFDEAVPHAKRKTQKGHMQFLTTKCNRHGDFGHPIWKPYCERCEAWQEVFGSVYKKPFRFTAPCCAQFAVDRKAVLGRPKAFWQNAIDAIPKLVDAQIKEGNTRKG